MRGRDRFNGEEIAWIRDQLTELRGAERDDQKRIRRALRRHGFRITDWRVDGTPFTVLDFDALLASGQIVAEETVDPISQWTGPVADLHVPSADKVATPRPDSLLDEGESGDVAAWVRSQLPPALLALQSPRLHVAEARDQVPDAPGLYAMYGAADTWRALGLGDPPDDRPLYVGKAEDSLVTRDLDQHFATGKTGHSSPRRSYAALLANELNLIARPRRWPDPEPKKFHCYALQPDSDQRLTAWMLAHLRLAVWSYTVPLSLDALETAVLQELMPPLNLNKVEQPWRRQVRDIARKQMAHQALEWARRRGWRP